MTTTAEQMIEAGTVIPEPGIYFDVSFETYQSWPYMNQSTLKTGQRSMMHLQHYQQRPSRPISDAMKFGRFIHTAGLEPLAIADRYVVMPKFEDDIMGYTRPKASKEYKDKVAAFTATNFTREIVTQSDYDNMMGMVKAMRENTRALSWLHFKGKNEVSIVWDDADTGVRCKARLDKLQDEDRLIPDLKTTADASRFEKSIVKYGYDIQAAFYCDGMYELTGNPHWFCIVAVESEAPFGVRSATLSDASVEVGRGTYKKLLAQYAAAKKSGCWQGYDDPTEWELPKWALPDERFELTKSGIPL